MSERIFKGRAVVKGNARAEALVSKGGQSIPRIFAERNIDYFITSCDAESVEKGIELIAARHKIARYVNEVKQIQEDLYGMYTRMNDIVENMPVRLDNYWEGEHFRTLTEQKCDPLSGPDPDDALPAEIQKNDD